MLTSYKSFTYFSRLCKNVLPPTFCASIDNLVAGKSPMGADVTPAVTQASMMDKAAHFSGGDNGKTEDARYKLKGLFGDKKD